MIYLAFDSCGEVAPNKDTFSQYLFRSYDLYNCK